MSELPTAEELHQRSGHKWKYREVAEVWEPAYVEARERALRAEDEVERLRWVATCAADFLAYVDGGGRVLHRIDDEPENYYLERDSLRAALHAAEEARRG